VTDEQQRDRAFSDVTLRAAVLLTSDIVAHFSRIARIRSSFAPRLKPKSLAAYPLELINQDTSRKNGDAADSRARRIGQQPNAEDR
jgi:hypothetical protein